MISARIESESRASARAGRRLHLARRRRYGPERRHAPWSPRAFRPDASDKRRAPGPPFDEGSLGRATGASSTVGHGCRRPAIARATKDRTWPNSSGRSAAAATVHAQRLRVSDHEGRCAFLDGLTMAPRVPKIMRPSRQDHRRGATPTTSVRIGANCPTGPNK
jgi:hypothetical protein